MTRERARRGVAVSSLRGKRPNETRVIFAGDDATNDEFRRRPDSYPRRRSGAFSARCRRARGGHAPGGLGVMNLALPGTAAARAPSRERTARGRANGPRERVSRATRGVLGDRGDVRGEARGVARDYSSGRGGVRRRAPSSGRAIGAGSRGVVARGACRTPSGVRHERVGSRRRRREHIARFRVRGASRPRRRAPTPPASTSSARLGDMRVWCTGLGRVFICRACQASRSSRLSAPTHSLIR